MVCWPTSRPLAPPRRRGRRFSFGFPGFVLTTLVSLPLAAGEPAWQQRTWKTEQGLPNNAVECLLQGRDGYLWIGTREGLARFDGVEFTVFDGRTPGFTDDACLALAEDAEGDLWIATKKGVYRRHRGRFARFGVDQGLPHDHVRQLRPGHRDGILWMAGPGGVAGWREGRFTCLPDSVADLTGAAVPAGWPDAECVHPDRDGTLWVGSPAGLFHFDPKHGRHHLAWTDPDPAARPTYPIVRRVLRDRAGALWFGTDHLLIRQRGEQISQFDFPGNIGEERLRCLMEGPGGQLWVVRGGGLYRASEVGLTRFDHPAELGDLFVTDVLVDAEGNLWIGTRYGGLRQLRPARLRVLTTADGLPHNTVRSVSRAPAGDRLWIATAGGLAVVENHHLQPVTDLDRVLPLDLRMAWEDRAGRLWITEVSGTAGCFERTANGFRRLPAGTLAGGGRAAMEDQSGRLWFGTPAGVACAITDSALQVGAMDPAPPGLPNWVEWWLYAPDRIVLHQGAAVWTMTPTHWFYADAFRTNRFPRSIALPDRVAACAPVSLDHCVNEPEVRCLAEDPAGNLWWGTQAGGLHRLEGGGADRGPTRVASGPGPLHAIAADPGVPGSLWIALETGLARLERGRLHRFTSDEGLPEGPVHQILPDLYDNLWLSTFRGLFRCRSADLRSLAAGRIARAPGLWLGEAEGLLNANLDNASDLGAAIAADGSLWFATPQGIAVVDPRHVQRNERPPPVAITQIRTATDSFSEAKDRLRLAPGSGRRLEVAYAALSFRAPERLRYRFRLEGHDDDWIDAGSRRMAYYTNLKPGTYIFRVIAGNEDEVWNETGASLAITLTPFIHQTTWFAILTGAALLGLGTVVYRLHLRAVRAEQRTLIARSMHDQLAGKLAALAKAADSAAVTTTAAAPAAPSPRVIAELARSALRTLRQSISLNDPNADNLSGLVHQIVQIAEEMLLPLELRLRLDVPIEVPHRPLPARFREPVVLIASEALNNILKHAEASTVEVRLRFPNHYFLLEISDDGRGIPADALQRHPDGGLAHLHHRAARLQARLEFRPRPAGGTSVLLSVPFP